MKSFLLMHVFLLVQAGMVYSATGAQRKKKTSTTGVQTKSVQQVQEQFN